MAEYATQQDKVPFARTQRDVVPVGAEFKCPSSGLQDEDLADRHMYPDMFTVITLGQRGYKTAGLSWLLIDKPKGDYSRTHSDHYSPCAFYIK